MCFHKWSKWVDVWIEISLPIFSWFGKNTTSIEIGQKRYCLKCNRKQIKRIDSK